MRFSRIDGAIGIELAQERLERICDRDASGRRLCLGIELGLIHLDQRTDAP
jgi:hypothetical protein